MKKIKDFTHKDCCLNCEGFCFWDGDYCCFPQMEIHQYGANRYTEFDSKPNKGFFSDTRMFGDIDKTMVLGKDCEDYKKWGTYMYTDLMPNDFIPEYKKFKAWERLCKQLEDHVSDPSGIYDNWFRYHYFPRNLNNK